jgi:enoyl-CoA hydratase/carnithine racemase
MSDGSVHLNLDGHTAWITFDRPQARNAMTWTMYTQLAQICEQLRANPAVRVAVFRGAGGQAFVAGTDIAQFLEFGASGDAGADGIAYEQRIDECLRGFATLPMPTIAVIDGWAVGGGLAIATGCDFRLSTPAGRFGVPIARTLGNCLSIGNLARLESAFGAQRVRRMLLLAEIIDAPEAQACGYVHSIVDADGIEAAARDLAGRLAALAPITQRVAKEGLRRLASANLPDDHDLIRLTYASADFREGVSAFVAKRPPAWQGH